MSVFETLNAVNVNGHSEKKNGLTYLSWAWAWAEVKKAYPDAQYTIYETPEGCFYWTDGRTCWVKTGVTINGLEHIEYLPVMDYRNAAIQLEKVTSTDVNKAIQRSLTKACARHGLCWSNKQSYEWCFDGEPQHSIVAISSVGTQKSKQNQALFEKGVRAALARLEPSEILWYGKCPEEFDWNVTRIQPYYKRVRRRCENGR